MMLNELLTVMIVPFGGGMIVSFTALWALWWLGLSWLWMFIGVPIVWALTYVNLQLADGLAIGVVVAISINGLGYMLFDLMERMERWEKRKAQDDPFKISSPGPM